MHMPFGLMMFQDVFQMCMDQITDHLPGIIAIHNDVCVFGRGPKEHRHLIKLMRTVLKNRIMLTAANVGPDSQKSAFMVLCSLPKV